MRLKSLTVAVAIMLCTTVSFSGENKVTKKVENYENMMALADTIRALNIEKLNWEKKYYQEKAKRLQAVATNLLWENQEFRETWQLMIDTDKKIKQMQLVGAESPKPEGEKK